MSEGNGKRLTPLESLVMGVVWESGQVTVRQVRDQLEPVKPMAYNTVLTVMRILRDKGFLDTTRKGRMDIYRACVSRQQMAKRSLGEVVERFFSGSALALVSQLLASDGIDEDELIAIRREINRKLEKNGE